MLLRFAACLWLLTDIASFAAEPWQQVLQRMGLPANTPPVNRDNAILTILRAFESNDVVKGIVILPGVSDDFYLINRDQPRLNLRAGNLLEVISALTNATALRATFQPPLLLVHREEDNVQPRFIIEDSKAEQRLKKQKHMPRVLYCDTHWLNLQPALEKKLRRAVQPAAKAEEARHFARHNFVGWGLTDWELLTAISLSGRTRITIQKLTVKFRL